MSKLTRRGFLGAVGAAALPAWFPRLAFAAPGRLAALPRPTSSAICTTTSGSSAPRSWGW